MISQAISDGCFDGGRRLLDSSSGNAGIAYAMIGAALGLPVTIVVPGNASQERLERIAAYGAELIVTDPIEGYDFACAKRIAWRKNNPGVTGTAINIAMKITGVPITKGQARRYFNS
jgi:cysteine synthase B